MATKKTEDAATTKKAQKAEGAEEARTAKKGTTGKTAGKPETKAKSAGKDAGKDAQKGEPAAVLHMERPEGVADQETERRMPTPEEAEARITGKDRIHVEALGLPWAILLGGDPAKLMGQVLGTVLSAGGTRPAWRWRFNTPENVLHDSVLMAWPKEQPVRAAVLVSGPVGEKMRPVDAFPLLQGLPVDLTVEEVHPWEHGRGANVGAIVEEGYSPMWFYDPLYERDKQDLTPGVTQTFLVAGLAFGVRRALLDEVTITQGPYYEAHAQKWLEENPGKTRLDVPPLKIPVAGRQLIFPGRAFGQYELRAKVDKVDDFELDRMPVKVLYLTFPFENHPPMTLPLYAPKSVLKDYEPAVGDEVDAVVWLQGRIIDMEDSGGMTEGLEPDTSDNPKPTPNA